MLRVFAVCLSLLVCVPPPAAARDEVDLELVLAVDVSLSMDLDELRLQREGYVAALRDPEILRAIAGGLVGRIAVAYVEWAGWGQQHVVVPWTAIDGPASAEAVAARIEAAPTLRLRRTSISGAMRASLDLFEASPFRARRRVVDISGDGPNNDGPSVVVARQELLARGVVVNGLPLVLKRQQSGWFDIEQLDEYYADCVIGGPGSFSIAVREIAQLREAVRTKLIMEITDLGPPARVVPAASESPRVPCDIGEQIWRRWMDR